MAIVVHERSEVDSLTLEQIQSIFSGKARSWSAFGGQRKTIRRYGLTYVSPLTSLFHEKVIEVAKCGVIARKNRSADVLAALVGDADGIAFVDAVTAMSAGNGVKIVAIGDGKAAVAPNAQTLKSGTYPLAGELVLYVSPQAPPASRKFSAFILAGKGDAIIRQHGFMPSLRSAGSDLLAAFEKLYGADIKRAKATVDTDDDMALAAQMLQSSRTGKLAPEIIAAMCEAAYELSVGVSGGETLAFEALGVLSGKVPDKRFDCAVKRAALWERVYKEGKSSADGKFLVQALAAAGDLGMSSRWFSDAADIWTRALAVAEEVESPMLTSIKKRMPAFTARAQSIQQAEALAVKLRLNSRDVDVRRRMLMIQLIELDQPAEAMKYLDAATDEEMKTNILLAVEPLKKLSAEAAVKLAEWYVALTGKGGVGGEELMAARARACYLYFFTLHKDRGDALAIRAVLGMQKLGSRVSGPAVTPPPPKRGKKPSVSAGLKPGEEITNLRLAEFVAANPGLKHLTSREIGAVRQVTDLRPLMRLKKLTTLELSQAGKIKDLSPLTELTNLTSLTLTGLEIDNIAVLSGLSKLTVLNINNSPNVADIAPIGRLLRLGKLNLSGCVKVSNLTPIAALTDLTALNLSGCEGVTDIAPLEKVSRTLVTLNLRGTRTDRIVIPLGRMKKLKTLDLRRCDEVSPSDVARLARRLSKCRVLSDAPAKAPKSASPRRL